jgi:hypothetical protein
MASSFCVVFVAKNPPINNIAVIQLNNTIELYSASLTVFRNVLGSPLYNFLDILSPNIPRATTFTTRLLFHVSLAICMVHDDTIVQSEWMVRIPSHQDGSRGHGMTDRPRWRSSNSSATSSSSIGSLLSNAHEKSK